MTQAISCGFCIDLNRSHGEKKMHCSKKNPPKLGNHRIIQKIHFFDGQFPKVIKKHSMYIADIKPTYFLHILTMKISKIYVRYVRYM